MIPTVTLTTGLPGSGKTTQAKQLVGESNGQLRRVNLDDLRVMLDNGLYSKEHEKTALIIQDRIVLEAVREGFDVIVDNTHLHKRIPERIRAALAPYDVNWKVRNFLDVPVSECVRRDLERKTRGERNVGVDVITSMARKRPSWLLTEDWLYDYYKPDKYIPADGGYPAVICDLDGTLCITAGRSPYDTEKCGQDKCNGRVKEYLRRQWTMGASIILMSGRDEEFRPQTEDWLERFGIDYAFLLMRPTGDKSRDDMVKARLFDENVRGNYGNIHVLDDRNRVVNMWRRMGLETWQVADGDF